MLRGTMESDLVGVNTKWGKLNHVRRCCVGCELVVHINKKMSRAFSEPKQTNGRHLKSGSSSICIARRYLNQACLPESRLSLRVCCILTCETAVLDSSFVRISVQTLTFVPRQQAQSASLNLRMPLCTTTHVEQDCILTLCLHICTDICLHLHLQSMNTCN